MILRGPAIEERGYDTEGVCRIPRGLGSAVVWFACGRLAVGVLEHGGIQEVVYYGRQQLWGHDRLLLVDDLGGFQKILRALLLVDEQSYVLVPNNTQIYASGYVSRFSVEALGIEVEHSLVLSDARLFISIRVIANPGNHLLGLRCILTRGVLAAAERREWADWRKQEGADGAAAFVAIAKDSDDERSMWSFIGVTGKNAVEMRQYNSPGGVAPVPGRWHFQAERFVTGEATLAVVFDHDELTFRPRLAEAAAISQTEPYSAVAHWREVLARSPSVTGVSATTSSFFKQFPNRLYSHNCSNSCS